MRCAGLPKKPPFVNSWHWFGLRMSKKCRSILDWTKYIVPSFQSKSGSISSEGGETIWSGPTSPPVAQVRPVRGRGRAERAKVERRGKVGGNSMEDPSQVWNDWPFCRSSIQDYFGYIYILI